MTHLYFKFLAVIVNETQFNETIPKEATAYNIFMDCFVVALLAMTGKIVYEADNALTHDNPCHCIATADFAGSSLDFLYSFDPAYALVC